MSTAGIAAIAAQGLGGILSGKTRVQFIQNNNTVISFDVSSKEGHSRESPATEFPIENGQVISDHIIIKPFKLELTGIISDTPIGGVQGLLKEVGVSAAAALIPPVGLVATAGALALFSALSNSKSPSVAAYGQLLKLQEQAQPVDVITSLYRYSNMWINSISVPRDSETGKILLFTVSLSQLLLVTPRSVNVSIFSNPSLSANKADTGQSGLENDARQGYAREQGSLFHNFAGGG